MAVFGLVKLKVESGVVAFVLDAVQAASPALKAHPFGLAHTDAIERLIGSGGQRLRQDCLDMVRQPTHACRFGILMQSIFGEPILGTQGGEGRFAFLLAGLWLSTDDPPRV